VRRGYERVRCGYVGCGVAVQGAAWLCGKGAAWLCDRVRRGYVEGAAWLCGGCGVAMWLARRAAVRQSRVRIPPGTPPLVQSRKSRSRKASEQNFPSAAAGDSSAAAGVSAHQQGWILYQYCRQKIRKINKKSAGKGTKILKKYKHKGIIQVQRLKCHEPWEIWKIVVYFLHLCFSYKHSFNLSVLNICTVLKKSVTVMNNALKKLFYSTRNCWKALTDNNTYNYLGSSK
jgi:hypothetical protein